MSATEKTKYDHNMSATEKTTFDDSFSERTSDWTGLDTGSIFIDIGRKEAKVCKDGLVGNSAFDKVFERENQPDLRGRPKMTARFPTAGRTAFTAYH